MLLTNIKLAQNDKRLSTKVKSKYLLLKIKKDREEKEREREREREREYFNLQHAYYGRPY